MDNTQKFIRHLSLCTGYGGIDLGLRRVLPTCRTIAYVEIEAFAIQNLVNKIETEQLDAAPIHTNLKTFPFRKFRGCVDILSGGFPCQPFSNAGAKEGVGDERHLFPIISEGIKQFRPSILFFENVEGMFSTYTKENEVVLHHVLKDLESMGYTATAGVFSASEIGAPHQRKRVFIMGYSEHKRFKKRQHEARKKRSATRYRMGLSARASNQLADTDNNRYKQNTTRQEKKGGVSQEHWAEVCGGMPHRTGQQHNSELADSDSSRSGRGWSSCKSETDTDRVQSSKGERHRIRSQTSGCSGDFGELAYSHSSGGRQDRWQSELRTEGIEQSSCNQGRARARQAPEGQEGQQKWPSRPNEPQYEWEEPRVFKVEPQLGGAAHGSASGVDTNQNRIDRLRLLGNGVVPGVAEKAFRVLSQELFEV